MTLHDALYTYRAEVLRVVDGDTLDVRLDLGLHAYRVERLRLLGVNAPEIVGEQRAAGLAAREYMQHWCDLAAIRPWPLLVRTHKSDSFGRWLAEIVRADTGASLNDALLNDGMATLFQRGS